MPGRGNFEIFAGKSPAYIGDGLLQDETKLEVVAKRLLWGKFNNAGSYVQYYNISFYPYPRMGRRSLLVVIEQSHIFVSDMTESTPLMKVKYV